MKVRNRNLINSLLKNLSSSPFEGSSPKHGRVWIQNVSDAPGPRIYILRNLWSQSETEHLKSLGLVIGMKTASHYCKRCHPGWRTNTAAWLEVSPFVNARTGILLDSHSPLQVGQDEVVARIEARLASITRIPAENGENIQVLMISSVGLAFGDCEV